MARSFYVGEIVGPPTYNPGKIEEDTAYRRSVTWLDGNHRFVAPQLAAGLKLKALPLR